MRPDFRLISRILPLLYRELIRVSVGFKEICGGAGCLSNSTIATKTFANVPYRSTLSVSLFTLLLKPLLPMMSQRDAGSEAMRQHHTIIARFLPNHVERAPTQAVRY